MSLLASRQHDHDHDHDGDAAHQDHAHGFSCELAAGNYNLPLHIAAIFIIMAISFTGVILPIVAKRLSARHFAGSTFQALKLFGAGVILSTALIHMLVPAAEQLSADCLPHIFHDYHAWAGALAVGGILFTQAVQVIAGNILRSRGAEHVHHHHHHHHYTGDQTVAITNGGAHPQDLANDPTIAVIPSKHLDIEQGNHDHDHDHTHDNNNNNTNDRRDSEASSSSCNSSPSQNCPPSDPHAIHRVSQAHASEAHVHSLMLVPGEKNLPIYLLELGIASHSIIIGIALGLAASEFKGLLIALCFHQFFEGLALSTVVMDADFHKRFIATFMVVFYSFTTPIGVSIGIALHEGLADHLHHDMATLVVVTGVLDAVGAGILLYDAVANIVVPHFGGERFKAAPARTQWVHMMGLWAGALVMAVLGRWA
ncbi:high-affinity Zn(2+) transporter zrt1 [Gaertneriomyces sp. JEL0708]|nr:high-affinity Zn(2+) transporter zrt1 [Gaertneriomyces sp. JEL0708]